MVLRSCLDCGRAVPPPELTKGQCTRCRTPNYGRPHRRQRTALAETLPTYCFYGCGTLIERGDDWVAAHVVDRDPTSRRVVSCLSCNQRAKGMGRSNLQRLWSVGHLRPFRERQRYPQSAPKATNGR